MKSVSNKLKQKSFAIFVQRLIGVVGAPVDITVDVFHFNNVFY